jgi:hypothetical protein
MIKIIRRFTFIIIFFNSYLSFSQSSFCFGSDAANIKIVNLPVNIDNNHFDNEFLGVEINKNCINSLDSTLTVNYKYYCSSKFISNKISGYLIRQIGASGGVEERFFLFLFDEKNKFLTFFLLGQSVSDCSFSIEERSIITKDLMIENVKTIYELDCDNDSETSKKTIIERYKINNINGEIIKLY